MLAVMDRAESVVLLLPEPPSSNRWWRKWRNRMVLSDEAKAYKALVRAHAHINGATLYPTEPISLSMTWHRERKSGDLDKRLGVLLDGLQQVTLNGVFYGGVYASDAQVVQIWARRCDEHPEIPKGHVWVEVCPM